MSGDVPPPCSESVRCGCGPHLTVGVTLNLFTSPTQCFGRNEDENVF